MNRNSRSNFLTLESMPKYNASNECMIQMDFNHPAGSLKSISNKKAFQKDAHRPRLNKEKL